MKTNGAALLFLLCSFAFAQAEECPPEKENIAEELITTITCGVSGTLEERQKDCERLGKKTGDFRLVSVDKDNLPIYRDGKTDLIWGTVQPEKKLPGQAKSFCEDLPELIPGKKWRLPTLDEYKVTMLRSRENPLAEKNASVWATGRKGKRVAGVGHLYRPSDSEDAVIYLPAVKEKFRCVSEGPDYQDVKPAKE